MTESVRRRLRSTSSTRPGGAEVREEEVDALQLLLAPRRRACACPSCRPSASVPPPASMHAADLRVDLADDVGGAVGTQDVDGFVLALAAGHVAGRSRRAVLRRGEWAPLGRASPAPFLWRSCVSPYGLRSQCPCRHGQGGAAARDHSRAVAVVSCCCSDLLPLNLFIAAVRPLGDDRLDRVGGQRRRSSGSSFASAREKSAST